MTSNHFIVPFTYVVKDKFIDFKPTKTSTFYDSSENTNEERKEEDLGFIN